MIFTFLSFNSSNGGLHAYRTNKLGTQGARWPTGLDGWLALATGRCGTGSNPTAENFASELWQFRLPRFASVFWGRHTKSRRSLLSGVYARGGKISHQSAPECLTVVDSTTVYGYNTQYGPGHYLSKPKLRN